MEKNKNRLTIISNDCTSYFIHKELNLEYMTPFLDVYITPFNYLRFLKNFDKVNLHNTRLIDKELYSVESRYYVKKEQSESPVVMVDETFIVQAIHYKNYQEFLSKWNRRVDRMNFQNLLFIYNEYPYEDKSLSSPRDLTNKIINLSSFRGPSIYLHPNTEDYCDVRHDNILKSEMHLTTYDEGCFSECLKDQKVENLIKSLI